MPSVPFFPKSGHFFQFSKKDIKGLRNVSIWFKSNKLSLNVNKTKWSLRHPVSKFSLSNLFTESICIKREHVTNF